MKSDDHRHWIPAFAGMTRAEDRDDDAGFVLQPRLGSLGFEKALSFKAQEAWGS